MTDRQKAFEEALAHPEKSINEYVLIFHQECGGVITGTGEYRCDECGWRFTEDELRQLLT